MSFPTWFWDFDNDGVLDIFAGSWSGSVNDIACLLYTSDAADERSSVDLGGRRIIKKKKPDNIVTLRKE